eukprot:CAMPEP_0174883052 /NCGR_PEP_ID=MMETSP1114-20130205/85073_1 /TAXON_ID=312471 /ORGANISM="Neobodo designis, Strain CCAP 1951/1" /LENGTH=208 /DNA_ID=CAMNT_0016118453 /DNA_START=47 /DNA_END=673 /DNA_ORIENTATION=+
MGGKGSHACIWGLLLSEKDITPILAGTVAFYVASFVCYAVIFAGAWTRAICVDKGVKTFEGIKQRYGMGLCSLATVLSAAGKSAAILAVINVIGKQADSLCMYMQAACVVLAATARYGMGLCSLATVLSAAGKSAAILAVINVIGKQADSLCMYMQAACVVLAATATVAHNQFWEQRPLPLIFISGVSEAVCLSLAAYAMWAATHNVN